MEKKMTLREAFENKMLLLDGGMGSVIQTYGIKGANNDMLSIEKPEIIQEAVRKKKMGLLARSATVRRIVEKMREIIDLFSWE